MFCTGAKKNSKTALSSAATGTIYKTAYKYSASFSANTRLIASLVAEQHMQSKHLAEMNRMKELRRKPSFCTGNRRQKENITYLWMNANLEGDCNSSSVGPFPDFNHGSCLE